MSRQLHMVWPTSCEKWESGGQLWVNTNNTSFNIWLRFQKTIVQSPSQCSATRYKKLMWLEPLHCSATRPDPYWGRYGGWWRGRWRGHRPSQTTLSPLELHLPQFHHDDGNWYKHQKLCISFSVNCNYGTGCKNSPLRFESSSVFFVTVELDFNKEILSLLSQILNLDSFLMFESDFYF